ncbi:hypothetical protein VOI54_11955 [Tamlana sp. 2201CG12-4]|uniref:hypothetical protein n=1 Tax=Tamlana sp. 2201CG12-4 TaxID=3112582 RepID=UPI002DBF5E8A|nr:hypothetical protein [Tamlana sp. 2201CG12-4]MEC3907736.1 hypothetical protein [Tamlana sp. 2201CG12-4]
MKKGLLIVFICLTAFSFQAQNNSDKTPSKEVIKSTVDSTLTVTLNSTIKTLYNVISAEKGVKRNWKQFKFLFKPDAKLIPSGKDKSGVFKVKYISPDDYIKNSDEWMLSNGFIEREIKRKVDVFGNIAQVFSTYEAFHSKEDERPFLRGINSIQLLNDGERWWIVNIFWTHESSTNPIPEKYFR